MPGLEGKAAVVTGAAQGIGQAYAKRLAKEGADVLVVDLQDATETSEAIKAIGRKAVSHQCDVSDPGQVDAIRERVSEEFGRCDILVNNAGIYPIGSFDQVDFQEWRHMFAVNVDSMFLMAKAVVPFMRNRGWGRIVNQASSIVTMAAPGFVHYIASKSAVIGFTRSLATELGPDGITVNAIAPGLVRTPSTLKRSGRSYPGLTEEQEFEMVRQMQVIKRVEVPDDLVGALAFLVSADAGFITGQTYYIDGGMTRS